MVDEMRISCRKTYRQSPVRCFGEIVRWNRYVGRWTREDGGRMEGGSQVIGTIVALCFEVAVACGGFVRRSLTSFQPTPQRRTGKQSAASNSYTLIATPQHYATANRSQL